MGRAGWFVSVHVCACLLLGICRSASFELLSLAEDLPCLVSRWRRSIEQRKVGLCEKSLVFAWCLLPFEKTAVMVCWEEGMRFTFVMLHFWFLT